MKVVLIDDERLILDDTRIQCESLAGIEIVGCFMNPFIALEFIENNTVDCVLMDIEMPGFNGIELAQKINELNKEINIIFITGYGEYALQAFHEFALGYLVKPMKIEELEILLKKAGKMISKNTEEITITTFGKFSVFVNDQIVVFKSSKSKELLAVCVNQIGGIVEIDEAIGKLWPDRPYDERVKVLYRKAILNLKETLESYEIENLFCTARGVCYINRNDCKCDLYDLLEGKQVKTYYGYYMSEYEWAEEMNYELKKKFLK